MNGYEFTRFETDYTNKVKAAAYDVDTLAWRIISDYERCGVDYRALPDYKDAKEWFIDTTMSCSKGEAIRWMKYYMSNAIAYGIQTKNLDWKTKFMAALDLFNELALRRAGKTLASIAERALPDYTVQCVAAQQFVSKSHDED